VSYQNDNSPNQLLVEKVLSGDTNAFSLIINNTERLVTQIIFKMISNDEDRKDIAQDVYLIVFQKLSGFRFQSQLSTWVAQIAYNTCFDYLKKKKLVLINNANYENESNDMALDILSNKVHPLNNETEKLIFKKEVSEILKNEIENLQPIYKTLITLFHNEDLSYTEITQITGLPEGTVKSYLYRARKTLKDNLFLKYKMDSL
jgi:RNA polymerase sigma-70 factor (ECF subfamily)